MNGSVRLLYSCVLVRGGKITKCTRLENSIWITVQAIDYADDQMTQFTIHLNPERSTFRVEEIPV